LRKDFKLLLEELGCVTPGKSISELKVLFLGRECFENLPEKDVMEVYELHQREIIQKAKKNFQVSKSLSTPNSLLVSFKFTHLPSLTL
jgi:hypothetical protein